MQIFRTKLYKTQLQAILKYIAKDKISASEKFHNELNEQIENLIYFPKKYRQSFYSNDESVRDMIFKKYTIIYKIDLELNRIVVLDIFNRNKPS